MTPWLELPAVFALRASQMLALVAPTLLVGALCAGALRSFVAPTQIHRMLCGDGARSRACAWLFGLLLPVCSIGMLPIIVALRRAGIRPGTLSAMMVAGGTMTPWTAGYLLDQTGFTVTAVAVFTSFAAAVVGACAVDRLTGSRHARAAIPTPESALMPRSPLLASLYNAGRLIDAPMLMAIGLAAIVSGATALLIPPNFLGEILVERSLSHALLASGAWLATYVPPEILSMRAGQVTMASTMPGLAVVLLVGGASVNAAVMIVAAGSFSLRATGAWLAVVLLVSASGALTVDRLAYDPAYNPEDTHAFEDVGRPYHLLNHPEGAWTGFVHRWKQPIGASSIVAVGALLALTVVARLARFQPGAAKPVAGKSLAVIALIYLVGSAAVAALSYYPPPKTIADDLQGLALELGQAVSHTDQPAMTRLQARLVHRLDQLPTSARIRLKSISPEVAESVAAVRKSVSWASEPGATASERSFAMQRAVLSLTRQLRQSER
ncbi:MAG TPA: permease [Tepidisphaeraceae bacterium]|nr:permease [Tepidisphaeraceae bacterium]